MDNKCAHAICSCPKRPDSKYCSTYCETAKDETEIACGCGHPSCSVSVNQLWAWIHESVSARHL